VLMHPGLEKRFWTCYWSVDIDNNENVVMNV